MSTAWIKVSAVCDSVIIAARDVCPAEGWVGCRIGEGIAQDDAGWGNRIAARGQGWSFQGGWRSGFRRGHLSGRVCVQLSATLYNGCSTAWP